jgi:hypothetical protein
MDIREGAETRILSLLPATSRALIQPGIRAVQQAIETSCFYCLQYRTRNLTKIWCKFDTVIFTVNRFPVFAFLQSHVVTKIPPKIIAKSTKIPCHLMKRDSIGTLDSTSLKTRYFGIVSKSTMAFVLEYGFLC